MRKLVLLAGLLTMVACTQNPTPVHDWPASRPDLHWFDTSISGDYQSRNLVCIESGKVVGEISENFGASFWWAKYQSSPDKLGIRWPENTQVLGESAARLLVEKYAICELPRGGQQ
jgi:hypothetical protein